MKVRSNYVIVAIFSAIVLQALSISCATAPAAAAVIDPPFELTQAVPNPPKKEKVPEVVVVPKKIVSGRIMEITEDKGVQKYIYIKFTGVSKVPMNQEGDIYADPSMAQKIGRFKIIEVFPDMVRAVVVDLTFKIGKTATASYEAAIE